MDCTYSEQLRLGLFDSNPGSVTPAVANAVDKLASQDGIEARGAFFTRPAVVNFILDLVGYRTDQHLYKRALLEPSFGGGDFLLPAIDRLVASWHFHRQGPPSFAGLKDSLRSVELHQETYLSTHALVVGKLLDSGLAPSVAKALADRWLIQGDFLLEPLDRSFDFVVGNPPYVRQELIPSLLLDEYRARYKTIYDRADLYVPFIERSLFLLSPEGELGFICADRWMKNRYGGPLRRLVADRFHLSVYVDMTDTPAFRSDVIAYPAVVVMGRERSGTTRLAHRPELEPAILDSLARDLRSAVAPSAESGVSEVLDVAKDSEPWLLRSQEHIQLIRRLEAKLPTLEQCGARVGIGVATGADKAFIGDYEAMDVESERKLPLVKTQDISSGEVQWRGRGVLNPFDDNGGLVDLDKYPRFRAYLEARADKIKRRHCAKKHPGNWYRTIDRIVAPLTARPKLLIPDIKGEANVVYEEGRYYPHHNLYYVVSDEWELRALQAVLLSAVAKLFVETYSTTMRGGYLRFQAQYLRRIRLPLWEEVSEASRQELAAAATCRDIDACNRAVVRLYDLSGTEQSLLGVLSR